MITLRLQPARVGTLAARDGQGRWYGFDVQLAIFALSLTVVGLLMAFTNSATDPLEPGSIFTRGLVWLALAAVVFVVSASLDHHWLRTFAWPIYLVAIGLLLVTLVLGSGTGDVSRWVSILGLQFQFSEVAKILLAVVLAHHLATSSASIRSPWVIVRAGLIIGPGRVLRGRQVLGRVVLGRQVRRQLLEGQRALAQHGRRSRGAVEDRRRQTFAHRSPVEIDEDRRTELVVQAHHGAVRS